tara:strand:- start:1445 stop:2500 length:1056 start_codon:yes stop_codon:yes gene_type:complete
MFNKIIEIGGRRIGKKYPPFIIAEMSGNHNQSLDRALKIVDKAAEAEADAVKLQTYTPDTITIRSSKKDFMIKGGLWNGHSLYDLYSSAYTPWEWHEELFKRAKDKNILIFSSPFDFSAIDFLEKLNCPIYKIASFEALDIPLVSKVAETKKPMIVSTGMSNFNEIEETVNAVYSKGCKDLILLHCVSGYPTPHEESHLKTIEDLESNFGCIVGLSDHTIGITSSISSISLGASVIEKHVTLSRDDGGPDSSFSLEPNELKELCIQSKIAKKSIGKINYEKKPSEVNNIVFRRSIYVVKNISKGEKFTEDNLKSIRPGYGIEPKFLPSLIGKECMVNLEVGDALKWNHIKK